MTWPSAPTRRPTFLAGDLVTTRQLEGLAGNYPQLAMVISVNQANPLPDAAARGMSIYRWSYWCVSPDLRIFGPIGQDWLTRA